MSRTRLGRVLIFAGVAVWLVWGIVWLAGGEPRTAIYLPFHLAGVIPGAILSRWDAVAEWLRNRRAPSA